MKLASVVGALALGALICGVAVAGPDTVAPAGWQAKERGAMTVYTAPSGREVVMVREITGSGNNAMDAVTAIAEGALGTSAKVKRAATRYDGPMAVYEAELETGGKLFALRGFGVTQDTGTLLAVLHMGPAGEPGMDVRMTATGERVRSAAPSAPVAAPKAQPVPAPAPAKGALGVVHIVFDLDYVGGAGGFTYPEYTPVYLLENGQACRCPQIAVEDLTPAEVSRAAAKRRGTWQRQGSGFEIRYAAGKSQEVKASLAKPTPIARGQTLTGLYRAIGGGGNVALGGGTMTAQVEDLTFYPDGSFSQSDFRYGSSGAGSGWAKRGAAGTYAIDGPTLTLAYRDGRTVRTSIFYSSKRDDSDEYGRLGVLWIGGEGFKRRG